MRRPSMVTCFSPRCQPPADARDDELAAPSYLGSGLEALEKTPGAAP
ncbi:hypothetical protein [Cupriavidus basilensis]|nr:hypothetical protein [Cupriavidus basilensis]MCP3018737.1 hypothetical protein [Cupriavidus basilensis]